MNSEFIHIDFPASNILIQAPYRCTPSLAILWACLRPRSRSLTHPFSPRFFTLLGEPVEVASASRIISSNVLLGWSLHVPCLSSLVGVRGSSRAIILSNAVGFFRAPSTRYSRPVCGFSSSYVARTSFRNRVKRFFEPLGLPGPGPCTWPLALLCSIFNRLFEVFWFKKSKKITS